jgi:hypothetical protein
VVARVLRRRIEKCMVGRRVRLLEIYIYTVVVF